MKDIIWKLFKETGEVKYFLLFKQLEEVEDENRKNKGNSNRGH